MADENVELFFTGSAAQLMREIERLRAAVDTLSSSAAKAAGATRAAGQSAASALAGAASAVRAASARMREEDKRATAAFKAEQTARVAAARAAAAQQVAQARAAASQQTALARSAASQQTANVRAAANQQTAQVRGAVAQQTAAARAAYAQQTIAARTQAAAQTAALRAQYAQQTANHNAAINAQTQATRAGYQQQAIAMRAYYAQQAAASRGGGGGGGGGAGGLGALATSAGFAQLANLASAAAPFVAIGLAIKVAVDAASALANAIASVTTEIITMGIRGNAVIETMSIGLGSLITNFYNIKDAAGTALEGPQALAAGAVIAEEELKKLQIRAIQTKFTTEELGIAYQQGLAGFAASKVPLDQVLDLTVRIAQAAGAIGIEGRYLNEEVRSLATGNISIVNSRLATALGITSKMVAEWKAQGTLVQELTERTAVFAAAGVRAQQSFEGLKSSLVDIAEVTTRLATKSLYDSLKRSLQSIFQTVFDFSAGKFKAWVNDLINAFDSIFAQVGVRIEQWTIKAIGLAQKFAAFVVDNQVQIQGIAVAILDVFEAIFEIVGQIALAFVDQTTRIEAATNRAEGMKRALISIQAFVNGIAEIIRLFAPLINAAAGAVRFMLGHLEMMARLIERGENAMRRLLGLKVQYDTGTASGEIGGGSLGPVDYNKNGSRGAAGESSQEREAGVQRLKDILSQPTAGGYTTSPKDQKGLAGDTKAAAKSANDLERALKEAAAYVDKLAERARDVKDSFDNSVSGKLAVAYREAQEATAKLLEYSDKHLLNEKQVGIAVKAIADTYEAIKKNAEDTATFELADISGALLEEKFQITGDIYALEQRRIALAGQALKRELDAKYKYFDVLTQSEIKELAAEIEQLKVMKLQKDVVESMAVRWEEVNDDYAASARRANKAAFDDFNARLIRARFDLETSLKLTFDFLNLQTAEFTKNLTSGIADAVLKGFQAAPPPEIAGNLTGTVDELTKAFRGPKTGEVGLGGLEDTSAILEAAQIMVDFGITVDDVGRAFLSAAGSIQEFLNRVKDIAAVRSNPAKQLSGFRLALRDIGGFIKNDLVKQTLPAMAQGFGAAFAQAATGAITWGQAFKQAMLGALAEVANAFGRFFVAKALAALVPDPIPNYAAAAGWFAAATAMFTLGGILGAIAGGGGTAAGGGGNTAAEDADAAVAETERKKTRVTEFNTSGARRDGQPFLFGGRGDENKIRIEIVTNDPVVQALLSDYRVITTGNAEQNGVVTLDGLRTRQRGSVGRRLRGRL